MATKNASPNDSEPTVFGHEAVTTSENYLLMAGLLADKPELRSTSLPETEWDSLLDTYARSERT